MIDIYKFCLETLNELSTAGCEYSGATPKKDIPLKSRQVTRTPSGYSAPAQPPHDAPEWPLFSKGEVR